MVFFIIILNKINNSLSIILTILIIEHPNYDRDLKCQYHTLKTCLTYFSLFFLSETTLNISNIIFAMHHHHYHHYFDFHLQKDSSTFLLLWPAKDISQGECYNLKHWTSTLNYKVPQVAVNCSHHLHKLRVLGGFLILHQPYSH